jgi:2,4-dienoyl-CoA reductase (NADPH2)
VTGAVFQPLRLGGLELKNRVLRSSVGGRFDNYDGSGTDVRASWDVKFGRGGVAAIISSNAPVHERGHIVPGYAYLDSDERIPFWRELGRRVHEHDCHYLVQLVHAGRERILPGLRHVTAEGATDDPEPMNGFPCRSMGVDRIREVVGQFARAAGRARAAGLDGVELAGANGMLFTQFLSPSINTRKDDYGGSLENRARFALDVVRAVRAEVGRTSASASRSAWRRRRVSCCPGCEGATASPTSSRSPAGSRPPVWTSCTSAPGRDFRTRGTRQAASRRETS